VLPSPSIRLQMSVQTMSPDAAVFLAPEPFRPVYLLGLCHWCSEQSGPCLGLYSHVSGQGMGWDECGPSDHWESSLLDT
jgi:hypothetical protein